MKYLPENSNNFKSRKSTYLKISRTLREKVNSSIPKRLPNEEIVDTFLRTRLYVESQSRGSEEQINISTLDRLTEPAEQILHIDTITRMRQQLAFLYFFDNVDDSVDTERILRWLRVHRDIFQYIQQSDSEQPANQTGISSIECPTSNALNINNKNAIFSFSIYKEGT